MSFTRQTRDTIAFLLVWAVSVQNAIGMNMPEGDTGDVATGDTFAQTYRQALEPGPFTFPISVASSIDVVTTADLGLANVAMSGNATLMPKVTNVAVDMKIALRNTLNTLNASVDGKPEALWAGLSPRSVKHLQDAGPQVIALLRSTYKLASTVITSKYNALPRVMLETKQLTQAFLTAFIDTVPDKTKRERILGASIMGQVLQFQAIIFQVFQVATSADSAALTRLQNAVNDKEFFALLKNESARHANKRRRTTTPSVAAGN